MPQAENRLADLLARKIYEAGAIVWGGDAAFDRASGEEKRAYVRVAQLLLADRRDEGGFNGSFDAC